MQFMEPIRSVAGRIVSIHRQYVFEYDLTSGAPTPEGQTEGLIVRFPVDPSDIATFQFADGSREIEGIRHYLQRGEQLGVVLDGHRVVSRGFARFSGYVSLEGHRKARPLRPDQCYLHYFRTSQEYRGRGLYSTLLKAMLAHLQAKGAFSCALIACSQDNAASIKGIERAGFRRKSRVTTIGCLGGRAALSFFRPSIN